MTAATRRRRVIPVWLAASDGVSHAHLPRENRTACGQPRVDQRLAWPLKERCVPCLTVVGMTVPGPWSR